MQIQLHKFISFFFLLTLFNAQAQWIEIESTIPPTLHGSCVANNGKVYFAGGVQSQNYNWYNGESKALDLASNTVTTLPFNLGAEKMFVGTVAHENKLYFAGGYKISFGAGTIGISIHKSIIIYDIATGEVSGQNLSTHRGEMATAVVDGKIMFAGGVGIENGEVAASSVVDIYDPATDTWTTANLSQPRIGCKVGVIGKKAWFCSGATYWPGYGPSTRVDVYDAESNTWSTTEVSLGRKQGTVTTVGKYLIFAGGYTHDPLIGNTTATDRVDILDTETNTWSQASLSVPRAGLSSATLGNKAYFIGGGDAILIGSEYFESVTDVVDIFNADNGTWSTSAINEPRTAHNCVVSGNKIVIAGGLIGPNLFTTNKIEVFTDQTINTYETQPKATLHLSIAPNPASHYLNIAVEDADLECNNADFRIYNRSGSLVKQFTQAFNNQVQIDLSDMEVGEYTLQVLADDQKQFVGRFTVIGR